MRGAQSAETEITRKRDEYGRGGEIQRIVELETREARAVEDALIKRQVGSPLLAYLR